MNGKKSVAVIYFLSFAMHQDWIDFPNDSELLVERKPIKKNPKQNKTFFFIATTPPSIPLLAQWMQVGIIVTLFLLPPTQTIYQFVSKRVAHSNYISPCQRTYGRGHQWARPNAHRGRGTIGGLTRFSM